MVYQVSIQHHTLIAYYFFPPCLFAISWQIPKSLPQKTKGEGKEGGNTVEEKKDKISPDGKVPKLEVEIKVDGKEEGDWELHPHTTMSWDQPRRLVNQ